MKVFVSSLITGMEPFRAAARDAITTLRHDPVMAEDFGAGPNSPQIACLSQLRQSDVVVLILGEDYGAVQASNFSATHEEYNEAKGRKPVFAFVQEGIEREPKEADFVREVQGWESGLFRSGFTTADDLRRAVTRALHDYALTNLAGPVDLEEMARRAVGLLPVESRNSFSSNAAINLAIAGGPQQSILRPVEIEKADLAEALMQRALFGELRMFEFSSGVNHGMQGAALVLGQERGTQIVLCEDGSISISMPIKRTGQMGLELIEESVQRQLAAALDYASWVLDRIDQTQRLTHVSVAASITGGEYMAWRTQRESDDGRGRSMSVGGGGNNKQTPVQVGQTRAGLRLNAAHIVEDLVVPLRRQRR